MKSKILFLTKMYPYAPAIGGDITYSRDVINACASVFNLTVLCGDNGAGVGSHQDDNDIDWIISGRQRRGAAPVSSFFHALCRMALCFKEYQNTLAKLLEQQWDGIFMDNISSGHALAMVESYKNINPDCTVIYISHECEYLIRKEKYKAYRMNPLKKMASWFDVRKVRKVEHELIRKCDFTTFINSADVKYFDTVTQNTKYVDLTPGYNSPHIPQRSISEETPRRVVLLGGRRNVQKRMILENWLEASADRFKEAAIETVVAGDIEERFKQSLEQKFPEVQFTGFVEDIDSLLGSVRLGIVADTVGGGFKLRLLTYVFQRVPIAGLEEAISGLPTKPGDGYLSAENLDELVELVISSIDDLERLNEIQQGCLEDCKDSFSWSTRAQRLEAAVRHKTPDIGIQS